MNKFDFTKYSFQKFKKLPQPLQERITKKLNFLKEQNNLSNSLSKVENIKFATHRIRIGDYRLILKLEAKKGDKYEFLIIDLGHRREVYR